MRDGMVRGAAAIGRMADAGIVARVQPHALASAGRCRLQMISLGTIALAAALAGRHASSADVGMNVFTAAICVVLFASAKLIGTFRRVAIMSHVGAP
jgi:hypothetical protein